MGVQGGSSDEICKHAKSVAFGNKLVARLIQLIVASASRQPAADAISMFKLLSISC